MNNENSYEKIRIRDKLKDLMILFVFIIGSLLASLIVMDFIIFPLALFSTNNKEIFTFIITEITWFGLLGFFLFMLIKKIYQLYKDGMKFLEILKEILVKPLKSILIFILLSVSTLVLIYLIYLLMNSNYYLLYKIINI